MHASVVVVLAALCVLVLVRHPDAKLYVTGRDGTVVEVDPGKIGDQHLPTLTFAEATLEEVRQLKRSVLRKINTAQFTQLLQGTHTSRFLQEIEPIDAAFFAQKFSGRFRLGSLGGRAMAQMLGLRIFDLDHLKAHLDVARQEADDRRCTESVLDVLAGFVPDSDLRKVYKEKLTKLCNSYNYTPSHTSKRRKHGRHQEKGFSLGGHSCSSGPEQACCEFWESKQQKEDYESMQSRIQELNDEPDIDWWLLPPRKPSPPKRVRLAFPKRKEP